MLLIQSQEISTGREKLITKLTHFSAFPAPCSWDLVLKVCEKIYHEFPKWPECCSYPATVLLGSEARLPLLGWGLDPHAWLPGSFVRWLILPPGTHRCQHFRQSEPPTGQCYLCNKGSKAPSSKQAWKGLIESEHLRILEPEGSWL